MDYDNYDKYEKYDKYDKYDKYIRYKSKYSRLKKKNRYIDKNNDFYDVSYKIKKNLFKIKSKYQIIEIKETQNFGLMMIIDNDIQLTEHDEKNYHEMLVHVPINYFNMRKIRVLIIGGGDGGTLREVLKHPNVLEVVMVDIDIEVINASKKYMPKISDGAFNNPRTKLIIMDGFEYIKTYSGDKFDLILIDSTDFNRAESLITQDFYKKLKMIVKPRFMISFNADNIFWNEEYIVSSLKFMYDLFNYIGLYNTYVPTYSGGFYSFGLLSDSIDPLNFVIDFEIFRKKNLSLSYYNKNIHLSAFSQPQVILNKIKKIKKSKNINKTIELSGIHYMLDIYDVSPLLLNNSVQLDTINKKAIKLAEMTLIHSRIHKFSPQGVTGIYLLAESHLSFHTWPEKKFISLDLYTCSSTNIFNNSYNAIQYLLSKFKSMNYKLTKINR